ncbi:hypothetical protein FOFC_20469, partial [Fusarium oxysporum]
LNPKTLLLLGEETTQNTPMPSQQLTLSTSTKENTNTPVTASGTTPDHTTTSTAGTHKTADQTNSKPTGQATDTTSQSADPTTLKSAETHSPTAEPWTCWTAKDSRSLLAVARSYFDYLFKTEALLLFSLPFGTT